VYFNRPDNNRWLSIHQFWDSALGSGAVITN
jgi:hypothetical protein